MAIKKVRPEDIPKDKLGDLQVLLPSTKKEYVAIGESFYEVYPTSAVKLMQALSQLVDILAEVRKRKIERILETLTDKEKEEFSSASVVVTMNDLLVDPEAVEKVKSLIPDFLEGVDPEDLEKMTIGQLIDALDKITKVNVETLPPSYIREQIEQAVTGKGEEQGNS